MDKPHKLNVHKTFLCRLGRLITSLLNCVPYVLTCQRALRATCLRADASYVLTCSRVNMLCVLTYSCVNVPCMPKCLRAITSNNKNKFSMTVLLRFLVLFVSFFFLRNKTVYQKYIQQAGMSLKIFTLRIQYCILAFPLPGESL